MKDHKKTSIGIANGQLSNRKKAGMRNRLWIAGILLCIVVATLILAGWIRRPAATDTGNLTNTFTVRMDNLTITVTESGSVKAQESTDVMCEVEGRGVEIAEIIPEGTVLTREDVDTGKIICQLNASDLKDFYNRALIDFSSAKANYLEAQEAHLIQKKQNDAPPTEGPPRDSA